MAISRGHVLPIPIPDGSWMMGRRRAIVCIAT